MRVDARAPTVLPDARIGLERELRGLLAERLDRMKKRCIAWPRQPAVEEHRRRGHDDSAVDIVVGLIDGRVSDAHWSITAVAEKRRRGTLLKRIRMEDAVERTNLIQPPGGDTQDV